LCSFSSPHHYAIFMRGDTPLTARLLKPVLADAQTGAITASVALPWYLTALLVSQPLHFGDYGGMPMQVIWAVLDVVTIVVLASGLYLWWARRGPRRRDGQRAAAPRDDAGVRRGVWAYPIVLTLLSLVGLLSALIGDGVWDWVSWISLGVPALLCCLMPGLPGKPRTGTRQHTRKRTQRAVAPRGSRSL